MPHDSGPHEVIMPALGMAQDTGQIVSWLKSPGDAVKAGDALFEVETDKATMEVEAPADGFLTDVQAEAGADVPVGDVIALISATAEDSRRRAAAPAPAPAPTGDPAPAEALPEGAEVIMPALGMTQDTGLIVAWHKAPGDAVAAGDILFEVETDKSTMEVEAGHDGFVAALLAEAGEEAPVGDVIAIISREKPDAPVQRSLAATGSPKPAAPEPAAPADAEKAPAPPAPATRKGPSHRRESGYRHRPARRWPHPRLAQGAAAGAAGGAGSRPAGRGGPSAALPCARSRHAAVPARRRPRPRPRRGPPRDT